MTLTEVTAVKPTGVPTRSIANGLIWLAVFLGGFVFFEPAPYELFLAVLIPLWLLMGLRIPRAVSPLIVLVILFLVGGVIAATQADELKTQPIYYAVTAFLAFSSCFFACLIAEDPSRLKTIVSAWIAAAVVTSVLGILGYFGMTGDLFVKFDRAAGGFQDPNVFGPFLVFPFAMAARRALTRPFVPALGNAVIVLVLFAGIFLSFSRAVWGMTLITLLLVGLFLFLTEKSAMARARVVIIGTLGAMAIAVMIALALTIPTVADLFQDRAQIVHEYDAGYLGRFHRYGVGFNLMLDHPLGLGAGSFGRLLGEDEHNIWLKALTTYGWLGFVSFLALIAWTLVAAFPLVFRTGPQLAVTQIAYVVFLSHVIIATFIDIDHWRHVFVLLGMLWGAIAVDRDQQQQRLAAGFAGNLGRLPQPGGRH